MQANRRLQVLNSMGNGLFEKILLNWSRIVFRFFIELEQAQMFQKHFLNSGQENVVPEPTASPQNKPGPSSKEFDLAVAQSAADWINSGRWRQEDGAVKGPVGAHNKRVRTVLQRINPNTSADSVESKQATRACLQAARIFPGTPESRAAGYCKYTDKERRAALLANIQGELRLKDSAGIQFGIPQTTLKRDIKAVTGQLGLFGPSS